MQPQPQHQQADPGAGRSGPRRPPEARESSCSWRRLRFGRQIAEVGVASLHVWSLLMVGFPAKIRYTVLDLLALLLVAAREKMCTVEQASCQNGFFLWLVSSISPLSA